MLFDFFFSSRRRHTRWPRDWSSDVALPISMAPSGKKRLLSMRVRSDSATTWQRLSNGVPGSLKPMCPLVPTPSNRSEERRVGEEGRTTREADGDTENQREGGREQEEGR